MTQSDQHLLLDKFLSDDVLNTEILKETHLKTFYALVKEKSRRVKTGNSKKIKFPLDRIYKKSPVDLSEFAANLETLCSIITNKFTELNHLIDFLNENLENGDEEYKLHLIKVLNASIHVCKFFNLLGIVQETLEHTKVNKLIIDNLDYQVNDLANYIIRLFLVDYFSCLTVQEQAQLVTDVFNARFSKEDMKTFGKLLFTMSFQNSLTQSTSITNCPEFWNRLELFLTSDNPSQRKQAEYIINYCLKPYLDAVEYNPDLDYLKVTGVKTNGEAKHVWQNFFTLLRVSRESNLNYIKPCLKLLDSVVNLHFLWQKSIIKIFLQHSQNFVVYTVEMFAIKQEYSVENWKELLSSILNALNRNLNDLSLLAFAELKSFTRRIDQTVYDVLIEKLLEIQWNPVCLWYLSKNVFTDDNRKTITYDCFELLFTAFTKTPDIYIRKGCVEVLVDFYDVKSMFNCDLFKFVKLVHTSKNDYKYLIHRIMDYNNRRDTLFTYIEEQLQKNPMCLDVTFFEIFSYLNSAKTKQLLEISLSNYNNDSLNKMYATCFGSFEVEIVFNFTIQAIENIPEDVESFSKIIKKLLCYQNYKTELFNIAKNILEEKPPNCDGRKLHIAFLILNQCKDKLPNLNLEERLFKLVSIKDIPEIARISFTNLFFSVYFSSSANSSLGVSFLEEVLTLQNEESFDNFFAHMSDLVKYPDNQLVVNFVSSCLAMLCTMPKKQNYCKCASYFLEHVLSWSFFEHLSNWTLLVDIVQKINKTGSTSGEIEHVMANYLFFLVLGMHEKHEFALVIPQLTDAILDQMLQHHYYNRAVRFEYGAYQDIPEISRHSPNTYRMRSRLHLLNTLVVLALKYSSVIIDKLLERYSCIYLKRYFPNSEIQISKLRILQTLLILEPQMGHERRKVLDFFIKSLKEEVNQACERQLVQWLIVTSLIGTNDGHQYFTELISELQSLDNKKQYSTVAFIVILYHYILTKPESYWCILADALLPGCMGANFRVRLYSQFVMKLLYAKASQKKFETFREKYKIVVDSITIVLEATGETVEKTLKTDKIFLEKLGAIKSFAEETILFDIPRLNNIERMEWENIPQYACFFNSYHCSVSISDPIEKYLRNEKKLKDALPDDSLENTVETYQQKFVPNKYREDELAPDASSLMLVASLLDKPTNLGGLARTCEVFAVNTLVVHDKKMTTNNDFKSLSMSAEHWVRIVEVKCDDLIEYLKEMRKNEYKLVGVEQTNCSVALDKFQFEKKTVLILGNEKEGIPPHLYDLFDVCLEIPQLGLTRSLNVHVAGATCIWEYTKQHHTF